MFIIKLLILLTFSWRVFTYECGVTEFGHGLSIGGNYSEPGQWPWLASLFYKNRLFCGLSIISKKHLLGAANCVHFKRERQPELTVNYHAFLGHFDLSNTNDPNSIKVEFSDIFVHPDWDPRSKRFDADIALYLTKSEIIFTDFIKPICLPHNNAKIFDIDGTVVGYGLSELSKKSAEDRPKQIKIKSINDGICFYLNPKLEGLSSPRMFCAGKKGQNSCQGDGGGPFMVDKNNRWTINGIVSVAHSSTPKFVDWIKEIAGSSLDDIVPYENELVGDKCGVSKHGVGLSIGGNYSEPGQWPWLASIFHKEKFFCSSSIISKKYLLSAAHCVRPKREKEPFEVADYHAFLGRYDLNNKNDPNSIKVEFSDILIHTDWNLNAYKLTYDGDISLFLMKTEIKFNDFIRPICLPSEDSKVFEVDGTVTGYGLSESAVNYENLPKYIKISSVREGVCLYNKNSTFNKLGSLRMFCAGERGKNPCQGDSGGPFMVQEDDRWTVIGIVSTSAKKNCNDSDFVLFTQVPAFLEWIREVINKN